MEERNRNAHSPSAKEVEVTDDREIKGGAWLSTPPAFGIFAGPSEVSSVAQKLLTSMVEIVTIVTSWRLTKIGDLALQRGNTRIWELIKAVEETKTLDHDWNGYGSDPPYDLAREIAKDVLLRSTAIVKPMRVAPSAEGGIGICFYKGNRYADIECMNTGDILATTSDGRSRPMSGKLSRVK